MLNSRTSAHPKQVMNALEAFQKMPTYVVVEGKEKEYREKVLGHLHLSENDIATFIRSNEVYGLDFRDHILDLEEKAYTFRSAFRADLDKMLSLCYDENEKLKCLERYNCNYITWAFEVNIWQRYCTKSLDEFAQWHIEQGGWQSDFQGITFSEFARAWALSWMYNWTGQLFSDIHLCRDEKSPETVTVDENMNTYDDGQKAHDKLIDMLLPLSKKNPQNKHIMDKSDFENLVEYFRHLITHDTIPTNIKPIPQTNISTGHIRYLFYEIHKTQFGNQRIKDSFIEFLHATFKQFSTYEKKTTKAHFSKMPKSYEKDFSGKIGEAT